MENHVRNAQVLGAEISSTVVQLAVQWGEARESEPHLYSHFLPMVFWDPHYEDPRISKGANAWRFQTGKKGDHHAGILTDDLRRSKSMWLLKSCHCPEKKRRRLVEAQRGRHMTEKEEVHLQGEERPLRRNLPSSLSSSLWSWEKLNVYCLHKNK